MPDVHGAQLIVRLTAAGLHPGQAYGLQGEWQGAAGGINFGTQNENADSGGKAIFQLDPIVLESIAHHEGPGTLTLEVTDAAGNGLGGAYKLSQPIV